MSAKPILKLNIRDLWLAEPTGDNRVERSIDRFQINESHHDESAMVWGFPAV